MTKRIHPQYPLMPAKSPWISSPVIVGEAPGRHEEEQGLPFVGDSGRLLNSVLEELGWNRHQFFVTNTFMTRPADNKVEHFFHHAPEDPTSFAFFNGKSVRPEWEFEIYRLYGEIQANACVYDPFPDILALGSTALWATTGHEGITAWRGRWIASRALMERKVLATWHPSAVLRDDSKLDQFIEDIRIFLMTSKEKNDVG